MEALHRQVLPFILRRMKEDVLQDLPPKIIQDYYCNLSPLQVWPSACAFTFMYFLSVNLIHFFNAIPEQATSFTYESVTTYDTYNASVDDCSFFMCVI